MCFTQLRICCNCFDCPLSIPHRTNQLWYNLICYKFSVSVWLLYDTMVFSSFTFKRFNVPLCKEILEKILLFQVFDVRDWESPFVSNEFLCSPLSQGSVRKRPDCTVQFATNLAKVAFARAFLLLPERNLLQPRRRVFTQKEKLKWHVSSAAAPRKTWNPLLSATTKILSTVRQIYSPRIAYLKVNFAFLSRYMPQQEPQTFPVAGVHLVPDEIDCGEDHCSVTLSRLTREHSGGAYKCEISTEGPTFRLLSKTTNITVAGNNRFPFGATMGRLLE